MDYQTMTTEVLLDKAENEMEVAGFWRDRDKVRYQIALSETMAIDAELDLRKPDCEFRDLVGEDGQPVGFEPIY